ncbi:hypothetical protein D2E25_0890 [Bifidobacterium goeldii]|uniref:DUF624 domain-containing protein n=1 Tax=Bifidobacterium goeldii TaxID=2306975 RepID=A0A430FL62_9BIFI|nr:hypothetical protein [Bifidobacterium goeldii]RSX53567.1 hypothetical protein D2E25_0890 [Bifidobacterium goeldii]
MAAAAHPRRPHITADAFLTVANVVYLVLAMSLLTLAGCLPLVLAVIFAPSTAFYPLWIAAAALSAPGVAASFAIFRDHPVFMPAARRDALNVIESSGAALPDWIAATYVPSDVSVAVFRPYGRAYRRLFRRALTVGAIMCTVEFALLYDAQLLMQVAWGQLLVPMLLVLAAYNPFAMMMVLHIAVEFPQARLRALLRNGWMMTIRRPYMLLVNVAVAVVYAWGLTISPILVAVLATGVAAFVVWAGLRWQSQPLALAMARESGDRRLVALYE